MISQHDGGAATLCNRGTMIPQTIVSPLVLSIAHPSYPIDPKLSDDMLVEWGNQFAAARSEYLRLEALSFADRAIYGDCDDFDDVLSDAIEATDSFVRQAINITPNGPAGWLVKAQMAEWQSQSLSVDDAINSAEYLADKMLWSIVRDLLSVHRTSAVHHVRESA